MSARARGIQNLHLLVSPTTKTDANLRGGIRLALLGNARQGVTHPRAKRTVVAFGALLELFQQFFWKLDAHTGVTWIPFRWILSVLHYAVLMRVWGCYVSSCRTFLPTWQPFLLRVSATRRYCADNEPHFAQNLYEDEKPARCSKSFQASPLFSAASLHHP